MWTDTSHFVGSHTSLYATGEMFINWNATFLVVVSARYAKVWIHGRAKEVAEDQMVTTTY